ncbi:MAG TPA: glycosyltransferase family 39 protein [Rhizomicrobium sp.]|jgi:4-amino-4-deoxy-L-arabinose transferase-like glycosyltransferase|nr:glycosyltransferase family 39 protein [Rhizomicrobium sp.]
MTNGGGGMVQERSLWTRPSLWLAIAALAIHLLVNGHYGFFRDELYFIVCGQNPAWGYVDQPPLIPLIAAWSYGLFGNFLLGFRLAPALAMAATAALTAEFARLLGGGRFAQWLAGICFLGAGYFLADGILLTTDMLQALTWLGVSWFLVRLVQTGDERWWIAIGLVTGISLMSKYLIAFYLAALAMGLIATPLRRSLARPWIYAGAAIALLMVLPNIVWQWTHGWPFLEIGAAGAAGKNLALSPLAFFGQQFLIIGPASAPVWLAGLWTTTARPTYPAYRIFPIAYVLLCIVFIASHGKAYYLSSIYPVLFAFGAVAIEHWLRNMVARRALITAIAAAGALFSPIAVPVLPVETYIAYANALGMGASATATERMKLGALPQQFADMFGWPEMAAKIAAVYNALPPADRARAVFFGQNYGEAAAIDIFGRKLGLPPAIATHNNYYLWGPRGHDGSVMIVIGGDYRQMVGLFQSVEKVGMIESPYAMPYETNQPIYVLRGLKEPMAALWPTLKRYR